ncbi:GL22779 [Drosophila persimilis]|uniref:GL22779 n=1 Tax=Drosophila persimilis TaxID=7234 RepID=B4GZL3_DROPE|nr:GL22779 [Drosophila persimilis]
MRWPFLAAPFSPIYGPAAAIPCREQPLVEHRPPPLGRHAFPRHRGMSASRGHRDRDRERYSDYSDYHDYDDDEDDDRRRRHSSSWVARPTQNQQEELWE